MDALKPILAWSESNFESILGVLGHWTRDAETRLPGGVKVRPCRTREELEVRTGAESESMHLVRGLIPGPPRAPQGTRITWSLGLWVLSLIVLRASPPGSASTIASGTVPPDDPDERCAGARRLRRQID